MDEEHRLIKERKNKLEDIWSMGVNPYPYKYEPTHKSKDILEKYDSLEKEQVTEDSVKVAGRIMTLRKMGKASFLHIQDEKGRIQIYLRQDVVGEDQYAVLKKLDMGDFIGVEGLVFRTKMGEITIKATELTLLSKSIRPLPEKYHGLQDTELRYRKRYLDLVMNPNVKKVFEHRSLIIESMRKTLIDKNFLDVETPLLQTQYGGANARPFESKLNALDMKVYMSVSPELFLKRLLVGGYERVFTICKNFRNEGVDKSHNPEFTMMECYQAYADLFDMMDLVEDCYVNAAMAIHGTTKVMYQDQELDFKKPWPRLTMREAIKKYADIDVDKLSDEELFDLRITYNINAEGDLTRGLMIELLFEELVEDKLIQPVFITEHPLESTPLAKPLRDGDKAFIERFEPFVCGMEIGNAYSELNDPIMQRALLEKQAEQLRGGAEEAHPMDEDFVESIEIGMPPAGGLGLGIDRMVMLLTNQESIRDVIFFPFMKPVEEK